MRGRTPRKSISDRFWEKVDRSGDGCWEWQGCIITTGWGYGQFAVGTRRNMLAHRMAYTLTYGPIPLGMKVCHRCDNPRCCRPDHLFLGTTLDNNRDREAKGRGGQTGPRLTPEQREEILRRYIPRKVSINRLADEYGVRWTSIAYLIRTRRRTEQQKAA